MYHYSNQQMYHHNVYEQCPVFIDESKHDAVASSALNNHLVHGFPHTVVTTRSENPHKPQEPQNETLKSEKIKTKTKKKETSRTSVDTSNFSIEERLVAAVWVHERKRTKSNMSQIKHDFRERFGREPPAKNTFLVWERKLFSTGSVCDAPRPGRPVNRRTHVDEVAASVDSAPALSLRARALALRVPRTTLRTILHKDLSHTVKKTKDISHKPKAKPQHRKVKRQSKPPQPHVPHESPAVPPPAAAGYAPPQHYAPIAHSMHTDATYT